jgi:hypothetical protein
MNMGSLGTQNLGGANIISWYPSMTSSKNPMNKTFGLNCAGFCNGRIMIELTNDDRYRKMVMLRELSP